MVAYAAPTRLVSVRIVQDLQNNNYFLQKVTEKFGSSKYFCYLCIVKMMTIAVKFFEMGTGIWCNGSTTDFGSVCSGSNPDIPTNLPKCCKGSQA